MFLSLEYLNRFLIAELFSVIVKLQKTNTSVYRMPNIFVLEIKIRTNVSTCISLLRLLVKLLVTNRKCSHAINDLFMYQAK